MALTPKEHGMSDEYDEYGFDEDDSLTASLVVGWHAIFKWDDKKSAGELEAFAQAFGEHVPEMRSFVPGRSVHMDGYFNLLLGSCEESAYADEGPERVNIGAVKLALDAMPALPEHLEATLKEAFPHFEKFESTSPQAYLMVDGPLSYGALVYGQAGDEFPTPFPQNTAKVMCQDMRQMAVPNGAVWGVKFREVEYDEVQRVDLSEEALAAHREGAKGLEDPAYWLCARYD